MPTKKLPLLLLDIEYFIFRVAFKFDGMPVDVGLDALQQSLRDVFALYSEEEGGRYTAVLGSRGAGFRHEIYPDYKASRRKRQFPQIAEPLRAHVIDKMPHKFAEPGEEADDMLGRMATCPDYERGGLTPIIVSPDKDLNQIPGWHYSPYHDREFHITEQQGLTVFYRQLLMGDKGDNIPGIPRCGKETAKKLIPPGLMHETDMYRAVRAAYIEQWPTDWLRRMEQTGTLLWIRRTGREEWKPLEN